MTHSNNNNSEWAERKASLTEAFQAIEDALIEAGYDDTLVETQRGTFHWITVERAQQVKDDGCDEACDLAPDAAYQRIEDALLKAGYDDITVATERGTFHWMSAERARERAKEDH
jgi:hypothetical protein